MMVLNYINLRKVVKMSITSNPILRIKDFQTYQGVEILNVYHYLAFGPVTTPDLQAFSNDFQASVLPGILLAQNPNLTHFRLFLDWVNLDATFLDDSINEPGQKAGGNDAPTFVNASYLFSRVDKDTRNGRKAITGLDESDFTGNNLTAGALAVHATALAGMLMTITDTINVLTPCILGQPTGNPNEYRVNLIGGGSLVRPELTTQNTRKT